MRGRAASGRNTIGALLAVLKPVSALNSAVLRFGRTVAWMALAVMVAVIILQVFFRYALNSALAWPDEAARFLMLWMTGLIAPSAYRWGGFVAIDMVPRAMPARPARLLTFVLLVLSACVLASAITFGWNHTFGFGGNFDSSSLRIPLDWLGGTSLKVKLRYMYGSLLVCMVLLLAVNVELILRALAGLVNPDAELPPIDRPAELLAEAE